MADSGFKKTLAALLCNLGVSANALTLLGLALAGASGWLSYRGRFVEAGFALVASGLLDLMDGAVARLSGKAGAFGGILDSFLDRYGDAFALGGLLFFCVRTGSTLYAFLAFAAIVGSFSVSYVRARAECEIDACRVGFWERGERIGLLTLALWAGNAPAALWILALVTHWTAGERLWEARRKTSAGGDAPSRGIIGPARRNTAVYALKLLFWAGLICGWRPGF